MTMTRTLVPGRRGAVVLAVVATTLVGCAAKVTTKNFEVVAQPHANQDSPVPLDVVLVKTAPLVPIVTGLSAKQWFQDRAQLMRDHPGGIEFRSWQVVPGQVIDVRHFPFPNRKGIALVVFADYLSEGVHRLRVDPMKKFRLILKDQGFEAEPLK